MASAETLFPGYEMMPIAFSHESDSYAYCFWRYGLVLATGLEAVKGCTSWWIWQRDTMVVIIEPRVGDLSQLSCGYPFYTSGLVPRSREQLHGAMANLVVPVLLEEV